MSELDDLDLRFLFWLVWGVGTFVVYSMILRRRMLTYQKHRDRSSFRAMSAALGYWIVAFGAFIGITAVLFGPEGVGVGRLSVAIGCGAFLVVGLFVLADDEPGDGDHEARRQ